MTNTLEFALPDESATETLGRALASQPDLRGMIFLSGELGAGKTTLVRGFLQAMGHNGPVKSPTYTLIEPYELAQRPIYHLDLYRLGDAEELEYLGLQDLLTPEATLLVEWPERAKGYLSHPSLAISLQYSGQSRQANLTSSDHDLLQSIQADFDQTP